LCRYGEICAIILFSMSTYKNRIIRIKLNCQNKMQWRQTSMMIESSELQPHFPMNIQITIYKSCLPLFIITSPATWPFFECKSEHKIIPDVHYPDLTAIKHITQHMNSNYTDLKNQRLSQHRTIRHCENFKRKFFSFSL
jgi:hypothetical protein